MEGNCFPDGALERLQQPPHQNKKPPSSNPSISKGFPVSSRFSIQCIGQQGSPQPLFLEDGFALAGCICWLYSSVFPSAYSPLERSKEHHCWSLLCSSCCVEDSLMGILVIHVYCRLLLNSCLSNPASLGALHPVEPSMFQP